MRLDEATRAALLQRFNAIEDFGGHGLFVVDDLACHPLKTAPLYDHGAIVLSFESTTPADQAVALSAFRQGSGEPMIEVRTDAAFNKNRDFNDIRDKMKEFSSNLLISVVDLLILIGLVTAGATATPVLVLAALGLGVSVLLTVDSGYRLYNSITGNRDINERMDNNLIYLDTKIGLGVAELGLGLFAGGSASHGIYELREAGLFDGVLMRTLKSPADRRKAGKILEDGYKRFVSREVLLNGLYMMFGDAFLTLPKIFNSVTEETGIIHLLDDYFRRKLYPGSQNAPGSGDPPLDQGGGSPRAEAPASGDMAEGGARRVAICTTKISVWYTAYQR